MSEKEEYDLKLSVKGLGQLLPIVRDAKGRTVDGFHREQEDKNWWSITNPNIKTDQDLELARLAANFCRRKVLASEMMQRIGFLIESGLKPEVICEKTGISRTTVYKYMPEELKNKEKAELGSMGGSASHANRTVTTQDTERVQCQKCLNFFPTDKVKLIDEKTYCLACAPFAKARPAEKIQNGVRLEKSVYVPKGVPEWILSWQDKKNRMEPEHSKREENLTEGLAKIPNIGPIRTGAGARFVIVHIETETDTYLPAHEAVIYADGPCHDEAEQKERDEWIRATLKEKHPEIKIYVLHHRQNLATWLEDFDKNVINKENGKA